MDRTRLALFSFLGILAFTLLAYGGLTPAPLAITLTALVVVNAWVARISVEPLRLSRESVVFLAASGVLLLLQVLPFFGSLFHHTQQLRQAHGVSSFRPGTGDAFYTGLFVAQALIYVHATILVLRLRVLGLDSSTIVKGLVGLLILEAGYGSLQVFASLKDIPFFGPRVSDTASGTLVGRNNFGGLMAMGLVLATGLAWGGFSWPARRSRGGKPYGIERLKAGLPWALAASLFAVALLLSRSRGGALSALVGLLFLPIAFRGRGSFAGAVVTALIGIGTISLVGLRPLLDRFERIDPFDPGNDSRWLIISSTWRAALHQPVLGFGFGSLPRSYRPFQPPALHGQLNHAHNEFVNLFFEGGGVGLALLLTGLICWFVKAWRNQRSLSEPERLWSASAMASVVVVVAHSLVDFDLRITSIGIVFAGMLAVSGYKLSGESASPRTLWLASAAAFVSVAVVCLIRNPETSVELARGTQDALKRENMCGTILGLSPYDGRAAWVYARAAQQRGNVDLADSRFEVAAALWPANPNVQHEAGLYFWEGGKGQLPRAAKCLRRLFEYQPAQVAVVMEEIWSPARAIEDYEMLLPDVPIAHSEFAAFLVRQGELAAATRAFNRGCPPTPANVRSFDLFADALRSAGQWGLEALILDRRLEIRSDASAHAASARAWSRLGAFDQALERIKTGRRIAPTNAEFAGLEAQVLAAKGDRLLASESYSEAVRLAPSNLDYRYSRGWVYIDLKMYELAEADFREVLRSRPGDRFVVLGLAKSLAGLGNSASARSVLSDYLQRTPNDPEVTALRDSLSR